MHTGLWRPVLRNVKPIARLPPRARAVHNPPACHGLSTWCAHVMAGTNLISNSSPIVHRRAPRSPVVQAAGAVRAMSWFRSRSSDTAKDFVGPSDGQEEAAKAAILEKSVKGRQHTDLMLRCIILDAEGNVKTISGQFKRSDLCSEHSLNPRDLRKIDSRIPNLVPTILVRRGYILANILHIRALVKADAVILFDSYGSTDSRLHSVFLYHLEHNLKSKTTGMPYEFRALDSILLSVVSALEAEMVFIRNLVGGLLAELEDDIDHDKFKRLLHYARRLTSFQNRARLVQEAIEEVLEQDEDLAAMYLTDQLNNHPRLPSDHEELEVLLETYSKQVEEFVNEADNTQASSNVQSTQEIVELILDSNRNALLALDLKVSIYTMGLGMGALVAGLFGMNLTSQLEGTPYAFITMSVLATAIASLASLAGLRKYVMPPLLVFISHLHFKPNPDWLVY
ncbi:hypothetical protein EVG20_g1695 [Dentipellis fragilis]|uniref:Magnesium transporter n=1 Tax=Dentipellis fragilis TaxID=205917 RepID=A0A4Y9Z938_9AGAM|nr:hypothetical protein EVG20_g1695 [Dentipellis fragilis]